MPSIKINVHHKQKFRIEFSMPIFKSFCFYLKFYLRRRFTGLRTLNNNTIECLKNLDYPLVIYANHPGWWDPIHFMLLHRTFFPEHMAFGPMDADALSRYRLFEKMGIFPVKAHSAAGAVMFLRCCQAILSKPKTVLWLTAGGQFVDPRCQPPAIQVGLAHVVKRIQPVWVVPLAIEYPFWNEPRPEALSCFGEPLLIDGSEQLTTKQWVERFQSQLAEAQAKLATAVLQRNANLFITLLKGNSGVGNIYDGWRWLKAKIQGKKFYRGHGGKSL